MTDESDIELRIEKYRRDFGELGTNLAIAFISDQLGVNLATTERKFKKNRETTGLFWLALGELVSLAVHDIENQLELLELLVRLRDKRKGRTDETI